MKKKKRIKIVELVKEANMDFEEALLKLWDEGIDDIYEPGQKLYGKKLEIVRKILMIPGKNELQNINYWVNKLKINKIELIDYLACLDIKVNINARKLPKGTISKLIKSINNKNIKPVYTNLEESKIEKNIQILEKKKEEFKWDEIGHYKESKDIRYLEYDEIKKIHYELVKDFKEKDDPIIPEGIKDNNMLASAIFRPKTANGTKLKYSTTETSAAALVHSLTHNHPFHNGNKRTAIVSLLVFLDENDMMLTCDENKLFEFIIKVSNHKIAKNNKADDEVMEMSKWICSNSRLIEKGEKIIPFRRLEKILRQYKCTFENSQKGCEKIIKRIIIKKGLFKNKKETLKTHTYYGGDGREVSLKSIMKIRKDLQLDNEHGIDSKTFYDKVKAPFGEFINKYSKILNKLSKL